MTIQKYYVAPEGMTYRRKVDNIIIGGTLYIVDENDVIDNYEVVIDERYQKKKEERAKRAEELKKRREEAKERYDNLVERMMSIKEKNIEYEIIDEEFEEENINVE